MKQRRMLSHSDIRHITEHAPSEAEATNHRSHLYSSTQRVHCFDIPHWTFLTRPHQGGEYEKGLAEYQEREQAYKNHRARDLKEREPPQAQLNSRKH
jgi:hypothetical protein